MLFFWFEVMNIIFFFFFFQAEDGIRDKLVTGVQTCALPISEQYCAHDTCRGWGGACPHARSDASRSGGARQRPPACCGTNGAVRPRRVGDWHLPSHASFRFGCTSRSQPLCRPASKRKQAAAPIIAALSVQSAGGGQRSGTGARRASSSRSRVLAATPPASKIA